MILALLVAKFPGVRKDGLNMLARLMALQTETEDEAKAAVERLTRDGVDAFVRDFRSDVDKEVSDGTRTFEENLRRKFDFVEKQSEPRADADRVPHVGAGLCQTSPAWCRRPLRRNPSGFISVSFVGYAFDSTRSGRTPSTTRSRMA